MADGDIPENLRSAQSRGRRYHGWRIVGVAFLVALFGWGAGFYGPGIYLVALQDRHGWPTAAIASAITIYYLAGAVLVFFAGRLFDRLGHRLVVLGGTAAMACGILLLTTIDRPWQIHAAFAVMSLGWAAMSGAAVNILVAPWFDRRRGMAVSFALNGASAGGLVLAPLLVFLIDRLGFDAAIWVMAALMVGVLCPTAGLMLRPRRRDEFDLADGTASTGPSAADESPASADGPAWRVGAVLRDWRFHSVSVPFALGLTAQVGFLTHQVAFLTPATGALAAGWIVSLTTFAAIAGRIATGLIVDRVDRRAVACGNFALQAAAMGLLASTGSPTGLVVGCVLFGLGVGNLVSLPGLIVQQEFPAQHFARIVSLAVAINQFTFAFGPGLLGYLRQATGDYDAALLACIAMQVIAALIVVGPAIHARRDRTAT